MQLIPAAAVLDAQVGQPLPPWCDDVSFPWGFSRNRRHAALAPWNRFELWNSPRLFLLRRTGVRAAPENSACRQSCARMAAIAGVLSSIRRSGMPA